MTRYWVSFTNGPGSCCIEAESEEDARVVGAERGVVDAVYFLPYPANPRFGKQSDCPTFCDTPEQCKGLTSCPKRKACDD
jgi:hypothetical protein